MKKNSYLVHFISEFKSSSKNVIIFNHEPTLGQVRSHKNFGHQYMSQQVKYDEDKEIMYVKERKGKQEAKKVLDELKSNYENLLQKFAAAENALDVVRFGGQPPPVDESREQTFRLADDFADRIGQFKVDESDLSLIESRNMKIRTTTPQSGQNKTKMYNNFFLSIFHELRDNCQNFK